MRDPAEHWKRSQDIADSTRRYLVALNGGAIALLVTVSSTFIPRNQSLISAIVPASFFVAGLFFTGISLHLAKHRELKRYEAAVEQKPEPNFSQIWWRSYTWDVLSFGCFAYGSITLLSGLAGIGGAGT